jgi:hypothetical protein
MATACIVPSLLEMTRLTGLGAAHGDRLKAMSGAGVPLAKLTLDSSDGSVLGYRQRMALPSNFSPAASRLFTPNIGRLHRRVATMRPSGKLTEMI